MVVVFVLVVFSTSVAGVIDELFVDVWNGEVWHCLLLVIFMCVDV